MPAIFLTEEDIDELLTMELALVAVEEAYRRHAMTEVANIPRGRARTDHAILHVMGAAAKTLGAMVTKTYTTTKQGAGFFVHLFSGETGELLAVMKADLLGAIRTGAVSGLATRLMARSESNTVGVFGSGKQARTQLEAVCEVLDIVEVYVYSPRPDRRQKFAQEMSAELGIEVIPVAKPELAAEDKDVLITATTSTVPVLAADWLSGGVHLNAIGSNFLGKCEVDVETIRRCDNIVVDDKEQCRIEAGELVRAADEGVLRWSNVTELSSLVVGRSSGRQHARDITLFKSVGVAYADLAVAKMVYDQAKSAGIGQPLPF